MLCLLNVMVFLFVFAQTAFITPSAHILTAVLGFNCKLTGFRVLFHRFTTREKNAYICSVKQVMTS